MDRVHATLAANEERHSVQYTIETHLYAQAKVCCHLTLASIAVNADRYSQLVNLWEQFKPNCCSVSALKLARTGITEIRREGCIKPSGLR